MVFLCSCGGKEVPPRKSSSGTDQTRSEPMPGIFQVTRIAFTRGKTFGYIVTTSRKIEISLPWSDIGVEISVSDSFPLNPCAMLELCAGTQASGQCRDRSSGSLC